MSTESEMVTVKEAAQLIGKSVSSIRRMLSNGKLKGIKQKFGKTQKIFIERRELLHTLSTLAQNEYVHEQSQMNKGRSSVKGSNELTVYLQGEIERLRNEVEQTSQYFQRKIDFLEQRIELKNEEIKRLNEEIKALLRNARQKPRGIVGYLVERITR